MLQPTRLLLIAGAGAITIAVAALFFTVTIHATRLLYPVLAITLFAAGAAVGSVHLAPTSPTRRSSQLSVAAFAAGMTAATLAFAVYAHFGSLAIEDPRHRVVWPMFAVLFIATILLGLAAFSAATIVTSAIVKHRRSNGRETAI